MEGVDKRRWAVEQLKRLLEKLEETKGGDRREWARRELAKLLEKLGGGK